MVRRTRAELRDDKERRDERAAKDAWRHYVRGLSEIDDAAAAQRFANNGPHQTEPGGWPYHNLGCFLHRNSPHNPSPAECEEFLKFLRRAEAAGKTVPVSVAQFERMSAEWAEEQKRKRGY
jgi:hypothetical protein